MNTLPGILDLAAANLLSPPVLFFALGLGAALARSDLSVPEAAARLLALYLLLAIGFKGGAGVAAHSESGGVLAAILAGLLLSSLIPLLAFAALRAVSSLGRTDAAAVAAHYGSISIVTFVAASEAVRAAGLPAEGYMVAVAAAMETPAILVALWLAGRSGPDRGRDPGLWREILLNGSVVLLLGAFVIGWITGEPGLERIAAFITDPFQGILCLFLLDMGLVAGRGLRQGRRHLTPPVIAFGLVMPPVSAALGLLAALLLGLSPGGAALLATLAASASYIAVPAAMRAALPEANAALYLTLSLGVTFPFNLALGIPAYVWAARALTG